MATNSLVRNAALLLLTTSFATLASCAGTDAPQASAAASGRTSCNFGAFVAETDPAGLNVRAAPNPTAKILGKLPPTFVEPTMNYGVRVEVEVIAARDGWFLIRNAGDTTELTGRPARPLFRGDGWVSGSRLTVKSQADVGRTQPSPQAPVVLRVGDNETFDNDVMVEAGRLVDCNGKWAHVEFADTRIPASDRSSIKVDASARSGLPPGRFRVWLDRLCGTQETSCDGLGQRDAAP